LLGFATSLQYLTISNTNKGYRVIANLAINARMLIIFPTVEESTVRILCMPQGPLLWEVVSRVASTQTICRLPSQVLYLPHSMLPPVSPMRTISTRRVCNKATTSTFLVWSLNIHHTPDRYLALLLIMALHQERNAQPCRHQPML